MEKVTDNMKTSFPSRMSDGRFINNYKSNCMMNAGFQKDMSSWQYKMHLMNNTEKVFDIMNEFNESLFGNDSNLTTPIPEHRYENHCDGKKCDIKEVNPEGFGIVNK